ncbi:MAG: GIY-YIG nuclease family protein [Chlorobium sp.]|uniref:GIY-YIG nuclease family protein n=1 Tax=Chlorobium sp. TaxID=1095 RepID=UPI002F404E4B
MKSGKFTIFGEKEKQGTYLLFIDLRKPVQIAFGSFRKGVPVPLAAGCYIYLGSALASRPGSEPLARRLMRHASRSGGARPHPILNDLRRLLQRLDIACPATLPPVEKKLHWHIDYLLERPETSIFHIAILRSPEKLEDGMAAWLEQCPETASPAARLGAQDTRNRTHLLHCSDPETLLARLHTFLPAVMPDCGDHFP